MQIEEVRRTINAYIHRNGRREITGDILNGVLLIMAEYSQDPDGSIAQLIADVLENKTAIEQEAQTARGYENQLYIKTSQEEARAKYAEARLQEAIDREVGRANGAESDLHNEVLAENTRAVDAEFELSKRIDAIVQGRDVRDIVANYQELLDYDTTTLGDNDIIMVLLDSTKSDHTTYYRWHIDTQSWEFIGGLAFTYTKTEIDEKFAALHIVLPTFDEYSSQEVLAQVDETIRHAGADAQFKVAIPVDDMQGNVTVTYVKTNPMHTYLGVFADDRSELYHITRTISQPRVYTCEVITKVFATKDDLASLIKDLYNADTAEGEELGDIVKLREGQEALAERIEDIERGETPNVSVFGSPRFDHGQVSGFSRENYLAMPFLFNVQNQRFELTLAFVMGADVNTPQNILGSAFSLAMYVQNGKLNVRVSSNGTDWNIISWEYSDKTLVASHPYFVSLAFDGINYAVKFSENGKDYTTIYNKGANQSPFARLLYLGIGNNFNNPFLGTINLNKCLLTIAGETFWEGMTAGGVPEAPEDGNIYGRKDGSWEQAASQAELSQLGGEIKGWEIGYRYATGSTAGGSLMKYPSDGWSCVKVSCNEGDVFIINSTAVSSYRSYAFVNSSNIITRIGKTSSTNIIDTAQEGEVYLVINTNTAIQPCYYGVVPKTQKLQGEISAVDTLLTSLRPQIDKVGGEISGWKEGYRYATGNGVGGLIVMSAGTGWHSVEIPCYEGEIFILNGSGSTSYRSYAFTDANNIITRIGASVSNNVIAIAQRGEAKLFINSNIDVQPNFYSLMAVNKLVPIINDAANAANRSNVLLGKKWVAVGDSFTAPDHSYAHLIADRNSMVLFDEAISGSGIAPVTGRDDHFSGQRLQTLINEHSDADYITICLGINDDAPIGSEDDCLGESIEKNTFYGAWNYCIKAILTAMPSVKIGIIIPERGTTLKQSAIVNVAQRWGIPYLDCGASDQISLMGVSSNSSTCMRVASKRGKVIPEAIALRRPVFEIKNPDNTWNGHPTPLGHRYWSTGIEAFMRRL